MISLLEPLTFGTGPVAARARRTVRTEAEAREFFERLVAFGKWFSPAGKCFHGWEDRVLQNYLAFHLLHRTLAFAPGPDGEIAGLGIVFQVNEAAIRGRARFDWTPDDAAGDSVCLLQWLCLNDEARRALLAWFESRHPHWRSLKVLHHRHGKLRTVPHAVIEKFLTL